MMSLLLHPASVNRRGGFGGLERGGGGVRIGNAFAESGNETTNCKFPRQEVRSENDKTTMKRLINPTNKPPQKRNLCFPGREIFQIVSCPRSIPVPKEGGTDEKSSGP
jgi:hypothetical protein